MHYCICTHEKLESVMIPKEIIKYPEQTHLWKVFGQPHVGQFKRQKWCKYRLECKTQESHEDNNITYWSNRMLNSDIT